MEAIQLDKIIEHELSANSCFEELREQLIKFQFSLNHITFFS